MKIRFHLTLKHSDKTHTEIIEYPNKDVPPAGWMRENWLNREWQQWRDKFVDGHAEVVDES